jgi:hypothetical protein
MLSAVRPAHRAINKLSTYTRVTFVTHERVEKCYVRTVLLPLAVRQPAHLLSQNANTLDTLHLLIMHAQIPVVAFLALATSQTMPIAEKFILEWNACIDGHGSFASSSGNSNIHCPNKLETNLSAAGAGFVLLSLCNFIWIIVAGIYIYTQKLIDICL